MKLLKLGVFLSMLLMTPVLEAQNTSVSLVGREYRATLYG